MAGNLSCGHNLRSHTSDLHDEKRKEGENQLGCVCGLPGSGDLDFASYSVFSFFLSRLWHIAILGLILASPPAALLFSA